ncbi:MAG: hypothetical protein NC417_12635 [Candidatus Gastranaerophilales bacterium]|nr:hypothetical protein [Candidatus Gastranaerophilales bacterium]
MERAKRNMLEQIIWGTLWVGFFGLAVLTIHDMQTAEGVGLYFALKSGGRGRMAFDITVDLLGAAGLFGLTTIPCLIMRHRDERDRLRFLLLFLAFMPRLSMAYLIDPFHDAEAASLDLLLFLLQSLLPFLCLTAIALWAAAPSFYQKWYGICCMAAALLAVFSFCMPTLQQLLNFILVYLILLVCFDLWERLCGHFPTLDRWSLILFGGMGLRAFYVLSQIMRRY